MKIRPRQILLPVIALLFTTACKKQKDDPAKTQLLTQQSWKYAAFGIDYDLDGVIDQELQREACAADDLVIFHPDGTGTFDQGSDRCYPQEPQMQTFQWQLHNDTQLEYAGAVHNVLSITETELRLYTEEINGNEVVRIILIYKH